MGVAGGEDEDGMLLVGWVGFVWLVFGLVWFGLGWWRWEWLVGWVRVSRAIGSLWGEVVVVCTGRAAGDGSNAVVWQGVQRVGGREGGREEGGVSLFLMGRGSMHLEKEMGWMGSLMRRSGVVYWRDATGRRRLGALGAESAVSLTERLSTREG
jgi:hypothetical protein